MSTVYRKTLKGIEEVAFNGSGLPMRLVSYLVAIDGQTPDDVLAARNPHLQSLVAVLQGLMEQGFLEAVSAGAPSPGLNRTQPMSPMSPAFAPAFAPAFGAPAQAPQYQHSPQMPPMQNMAPPQPQGFPAPSAAFPNIEPIKASMVKDVITILGQDAGPVVAKIRACNSQAELFALIMGIKKIITVYSSRETAERFASKYSQV
jgi:hypothetical protein